MAFEDLYRNPQPPQQFDTVVFFSGSTGAAYTVPLLRELLQRYSKQEQMLTTRVRFICATKNEDNLCWFHEVLKDALTQSWNVNGNMKVEAEVYVTRASVSDVPNASEAKPKAFPIAPALNGSAESAAASSSRRSSDERSLGSFQNPGAQIVP